MRKNKVPTLYSSAVFCDDLFDMRWRLEYHNKPTKVGMWNMPGIHDVNCCYKQTLHGLTDACIEVKNKRTKKVHVLVRCKATDYVEHRWINAAPTPLMPSRMGGQVSVVGAVQGMTLVTNDLKFHVYKDGKIHQQPMTEERITRC